MSSDEQTATPEEVMGTLFRESIGHASEGGGISAFEATEDGRVFVDGVPPEEPKEGGEGGTEPKTGDPVDVGGTLIAPGAGHEWDPEFIATISEAAEKAGIEDSQLVHAFRSYSATMRGEVYTRAECLGLLSQMHGSEGAAKVVMIQAMEKLEAIGHEGLSKLASESHLAADPYFLTILAGIKLPLETPRYTPPEPADPETIEEAKKELAQILDDRDHIYWTEGGNTEAGRRAIARVQKLYEFIYK